MKPLLLIDSYAQIFRSFYAVRSLSDSRGRPSNAVFAMMRFLLALDSEYPAGSCDGAFVFDRGRPAHRLALAPAYKANRPPTPEALTAQLPFIRDLIDAFGWPVTEHDGWEADDLIGCAATKFSSRKVSIVSADKDLSQLVDDRVDMLVPDQTGKGLKKRGPVEVMEKFGVPPSAIVDYLALIGDSSDNIPGVSGVGPKTAAQLLNRFGSIAAMLDRVSEIERDTLREKIAASRDLLNTNIALVKLVCEPPSDLVWTDASFVRRTPDRTRIRGIAADLELKSILRDLDAHPAPEPETKPDEAPVQMELF